MPRTQGKDALDMVKKIWYKSSGANGVSGIPPGRWFVIKIRDALKEVEYPFSRYQELMSYQKANDAGQFFML
jgi:hypothetical protein